MGIVAYQSPDNSISVVSSSTFRDLLYYKTPMVRYLHMILGNAEYFDMEQALEIVSNETQENLARILDDSPYTVVNN